MESLYFLNVTGKENYPGKNQEKCAYILGGKSTGLSEFFEFSFHARCKI